MDKSTHLLYAISKDRYVIASNNPAGGEWRYVKKSDWEEVKFKPATIRMEAIPWITLRDGVNEEIIKTLADSNGDQWRGNMKYSLESAFRFILPAHSHSQEAKR